jgi:Holliday junction resolvase RusA-like endonuclease
MVTISIPLTPPSVNHYLQRRVQGGYALTKEAQAYKDAVTLIARSCRKRIEAARYKVSVHIFLAPGQRGDLDNFLKLVLDGLVAGGQLPDDDAIDELRVFKVRDQAEASTVVYIEELT